MAVLPEDLLELRDDLRRERRRLGRLVASLSVLLPRLGEGPEPVEVAALRLHGFYTAVERALLLVSRVVNGGTPRQGEGWHRRLLERMAMATELRPAVLREGTQQRLQDYLRFRHPAPGVAEGVGGAGAGPESLRGLGRRGGPRGESGLLIALSGNG
jgi:hypothetical protein